MSIGEQQAAFDLSRAVRPLEVPIMQHYVGGFDLVSTDRQMSEPLVVTTLRLMPQATPASVANPVSSRTLHSAARGQVRLG